MAEEQHNESTWPAQEKELAQGEHGFEEVKLQPIKVEPSADEEEGDDEDDDEDEDTMDEQPNPADVLQLKLEEEPNSYVGPGANRGVVVKKEKSGNESYKDEDEAKQPTTTSATHKNHTKPVSTAPRQEICNICGKMFTQRSHLKVHLRTHSGERTYKCTTCSKTFVQSSNLKMHVRTHSGEKPYKCTTCGKMFSQSSNLIKHVRTHSGERPYKCTTCGKMFSDSSSLSRHVRTHSGEKPYKCTACDKMFSRSSNLADHLKTHNSERSYKCTICGLAFSHGSSLSRHVKAHAERPFMCENIRRKIFSQSLAMAESQQAGVSPMTNNIQKVETEKSDSVGKQSDSAGS